jgi:hypothetical protein
LRVVDDFERCEFAEVAGANNDATARALSIANRLRLTPVVATFAAPGAARRLVEATRREAAQRATNSGARAALAHALDLEVLLVRAGLEVAALAGYTDGDRIEAFALLTAVALEAARLLDENVIASAEEVDVLAVVGLGFPAWSGGPLSYLDMLRRGELPGATIPAELRSAPYYPD